MDSDKRRYQSIFIDTGGTLTDTLALKADGTFISGKASTTHDDLMACIFQA
jgi:N-methylhydantoinase A/oxoprolinase/acetone carboxylase beta subunit